MNLEDNFISHWQTIQQHKLRNIYSNFKVHGKTDRYTSIYVRPATLIITGIRSIKHEGQWLG